MTLLTRRRALLSLNKGILPQNYKQVEYIEGTGTQWIDTGIIANGDTKLDIDFQITEIKASFLLGSRIGSNSTMFTLNIRSDFDIQSGYSNGSADICAADTNRHFVMKNHRTTYLDGVQVYQTTKKTFTTPGTLELFACYNNGTKGYLPAKMKLFSCAIFDGVEEASRTPLRNFIPCYRKSDKVGGLYDTVSGEFFENQGTGQFKIGGEV